MGREGTNTMNKEKIKTYFDRAMDISIQPENCEDDNLTDLFNLFGEADAEIKHLKDLTTRTPDKELVEAIQDVIDVSNTITKAEVRRSLEGVISKYKGKR